MVQGKVRTLIVGAGASGIPLATTLGKDHRRAVTLLESGPGFPIPEDLLDSTTIRGAVPGYRENWVFPARLAVGRSTEIARGQILGGCTTVNGGYFVRATREDFDRWADVGGPHWSYRNALPVLRSLEHDLDYGSTNLHGDSGSIPVVRYGRDSPVSLAFLAATRELGFPLELDKNTQGPPGAGPIPSNTLHGIRASTAATYLKGPGHESGFQLLPSTRATQVIIENLVATAVACADGRILEADEIILCAGAICSAHLLLLSGIGPRDALEALDIPVHADLPVGSAFVDHPNLALSWRTAPNVVDLEAFFGFPTALHFDTSRTDPTLAPCPQGDAEILLTSKPLDYLLTGIPSDTQSLDLLVALQEQSARGTVRLRTADPFQSPMIDYRYMQDANDRRKMRAALRTAARLLTSPAFSSIFEGFKDISTGILDSDQLLDAWILDHLGTALHTCATAPMGSVVDGSGRVLGIRGLRVADTSILPSAPHRGPANTAVFIGELIGQQMLQEQLPSRVHQAVAQTRV